MTEQNLKQEFWHFFNIFHYEKLEYGECFGHEYHNCIFLVDYGPFKKNQLCKKIHIESTQYGDFTMTVDGEKLVPTWTHVPKTN